MNAFGGKTLLIANPAAQRGNGSAAARAAYKLLDDRVPDGSLDMRLTEAPGHAATIAESTDACTVIALGGDGIVHEVVNGLASIPLPHRPVFGLIPVGSGNDYARTLGMSEKLPEAIDQIMGSRVIAADLGCCNGEFFAETLSFGLDAAIALDTVARRERTGQQGAVLYAASGIAQLLHHLDLYHMHAMLGDGRVLDEKVHLLTVQVGPTYGGGFRICPNARIDDGVLDLCYATGPMSVPEATVKFLSAKNAHHTRWKNIHLDRATSLHLDFDRRPPCQIDGEAFVADSYAIDVHRGALRVLAAS